MKYTLPKRQPTQALTAAATKKQPLARKQPIYTLRAANPAP